MILYAILGAGVLGAAGFVAAVVIWRRRSIQKKQNQEQMQRKTLEDTLNRALSNDQHPQQAHHAQAPMQVHYSGGEHGGKGQKMIRLTEKAESVTKEYLFHEGERVFLGEEYGRAAVFQERAGHLVYCELFPHGGSCYVRQCGTAVGRLIRGKQKTQLGPEGIRLCSGDIIEHEKGVFYLEFI